MRCKVCGKVWCFTDEDIQQNKSNRSMAALSAIGSIASAIGGTTAQQHMTYDMAQRSLDKVVDFDQCPNCHSRDIEELSEEKFKELQRREQLSGVQVSVNSNASTESLLRRAELMLEDGDWPSANAYCDHVLDAEPENARAYMLKLMAELLVREPQKLAEQPEPLDGNSSYERALRFASPELKKELESYNAAIKERIEQQRLAAEYDDARAAYDKASTETELRTLADRFGAIAGFRDADTLRWECSRKADDMRREAERRAAEAEAKAKRNKKLAMIIVPVLAVVIVAGVFIARGAGESSDYNRAMELMEAGDYAAAESSFQALSGYKDSDAMLIEAQKGAAYAAALEAIENKEYGTAHELFTQAGDFKDAADCLADFSYLKVEEAYSSDSRYYEYDSHGRCTAIWYDEAHTDGPMYAYEYDSAGRLTKETYHVSPNTVVTENTYDSDGKLLKKVVSSENSNYDSGSRNEEVTDYSYDANGHLVSSKTTSSYYSTESKNEGALTSRYTYNYIYENDSEGRPVRMDEMDESGSSLLSYELYTYNDAGLLESTSSYSDAASEFPAWEYEYSYDENGNLIHELRTYRYGEDGNARSTQEISYEYDENGNHIKTVANGETEYLYGYVYTPDKAE